MTVQKRPKPSNQTSHPERYSAEIIYKFWAMAGGNVSLAIRFAEDAAEDRVPKRRHTWVAYAEEHKFAERLAKEEEERWEQYHAEREKRLQRIHDRLAHAFEEFAEVFTQTILRDVQALKGGENDPQAVRRAEKRLSNLFGTIADIDRFFRMYLRARGLPEHVTEQKVEDTRRVVTIEELEVEDHWASSIEEVRRQMREEDEKGSSFTFDTPSTGQER